MKQRYSLILLPIVAACLANCNNGSNGKNTNPALTNKIWTESACQAINAGHAARWSGISNEGAKVESAEICSNWIDLKSNSSAKGTQARSLKNISPGGNMEQDTVLSGGQNGANWIHFGMPVTSYNLENDGTSWAYDNNPMFIYSMPANQVVYGLVGSQVMVPGTTYFPYFPTSSLYSTNANYATTGNPLPNQILPNISGESVTALAIPRVCSDDTAYNVNGTFNVYLAPDNIIVPISLVTFCSSQGTTPGNFGNYSTGMNMWANSDPYGDSSPSYCTYNVTNQGQNIANTSMTCTPPGATNSYTFALTNMWSNLNGTLSDSFNACYLSGAPEDDGEGCLQNAWAFNYTATPQ